MIDLTIKTLDSQNHAFSVDDDITVAQFKERIAEVISIPVNSQRLIYCGRVLQDNKKLQEYDVNGKVVHLVQRAPPSATRRTRSPTPTANTTRRPFQGFNGSANAMYLGSMAFPSGLMEAQGIVPPPPTQSLSGSRLNVARRMIRRAESILNHLEDPQASRSRESPPEEPQDDVTPVFAAQVFVPHSHTDDPLASLSAAVSAVENGILQEAEQSLNPPPPDNGDAVPQEVAIVSSEEVVETEIGTETEPIDDKTKSNEKSSESSSSVNAASSSASNSASNEDAAQGSSAQSGTTQSTPAASGRLPENSTGTIEMSRLLDDLNKIHERMRPFMDRYHAFMRSDPAVNSDEVPDARATQTVINRVSEIMHLLGHAYHSLSDVMVHVNSPPPRPLLCRPILIQHSAVVQAGIPIQVEAQINLTPERRSAELFTTRATAASGDQPTSNSDDSASTTPTSTNPQGAPLNPQAPPTAHIRPSVHEIRIDSFPFEFRGFPRARTFNITPQGVRAQTAAAGPQDSGVDPAAPQAPTGDNGTPQGVGVNPGDPNVVVVPPFGNTPNMEFFMEVTPESITIDSLETTVVTSAAQADNVLRGTFGSPPPEFIQSIIQAVAGQIMSGAADIPIPGMNPSTTTSPTDTPTDPSAQDTPASSSHASAGAARANVNSQARGNTATHPTTATQTRSTSRPHVHLAQHTMQGFDPFLPCNSHHIRHRRRVPPPAAAQAAAAAAAAQTASQGAAATGEDGAQNNNQPPNPLYNVLQGLLRSFSNRPPADPRPRPTDAANTASTATPTSATPPPHPDTLPVFIDFASLSGMLFDSRNSAHGTTLASFLQNFPDHHYTEGESLFTDLIMTLARGLTFRDVVQLNSGHVDPLVRIRPALRTFFRNRVLEGECPTQAAIDRGANRLIVELQPVLELLNTMQVRDNIDIVQSATQLCRARFPNIISLVMSRMAGSLGSLVDQCILTVRQLCALALHSCVDDQQGIEEVFEALIARFTFGVSPEIYRWTVSTSLAQLRTFLTTLDVTEAEIQPFIVYKSNAEPEETTTVSETNTVQAEPEPEPMECEDAPVIEIIPEPATVPPPLTFDALADPEPLPNVVIGSEPWHRGLSADWIPIIARDTQRQRRQNPQAPFSDAYLSGMPSKRRKLVTGAKPQGNLSQVISEGVRRAVIESDLAIAAPIDVVAQAASSDLSLQAAYRDLLRTSVQSELRDNPDFTAERFPNAANYFNLK